jgi:subtilisin family serine protease
MPEHGRVSRSGGNSRRIRSVSIYCLAFAIQAASASAGDQNAYRPGSVLVRYKPTAQGLLAQRAVSKRIARRYAHLHNLVRVDLPAGQSVTDAVAAFESDPAVLYAEPDYVVHASVTPNDSQFGQLWNMRNTGQTGGTSDADIDAPEAWDLTTGDSDVVVAIIDTGIDYTHPDLAANVYRNEADCDADTVDDDGNGYVDDCNGIDTANDDSDPYDDNGHGTHVAGIIGAVGDNGTGVVGVNWHVRLLPCKFLDENGDGFTSDAIACLDYLADLETNGVDIVASNNSWGGDIFSQAMRDAIDLQRSHGSLFIAAAGNFAISNDVATFLPAGYTSANVISVAATHDADGLASFSNYGRHTVHLAAPGDDILSTLPTWQANPYGELSGTSMAAPHVAGVAALLKAQDPTRGWQAIRNRLLVGGDSVPGSTETISQRRLNARGALTCSGPPIRARLRPRLDAVGANPGVPFELAMLNINCNGPAGETTVVVNPGGEVITLRDDGSGLDKEAGDGIYTGTWVPADAGLYTLTFPEGDVVNVNNGGIVPGLVDPDPQDAGHFGFAVVAVDGTAVVSHPNTFGNGGAAYVYDGTTGDLLRALENPNPGPNDGFGRSMARVGDDRVLIGAQRAPDSGTDGGAAYLFDVSSGALLRTLQSPAPLQNGLFGWAVAAVGEKVFAVSEIHGQPPGYMESVHLFDAATGAHLAALHRPGAPHGVYGQALASDGSRLYVGDPGYEAQVNVYDADPASPTFGQLLNTLWPPPAYPSISNFGWRIDATEDLVFVGSPATALPEQLQTGVLHVFDTTTGALVRNLENPDPGHEDPITHQINEDMFAASLTVVGPTLLVGASNWFGFSPLPPPSPNLHGAVHRYNIVNGELLESLRDPYPVNGAPGEFGYAVAGLGDRMIVGNPTRLQPPLIGQAGAAYIIDPGPLPDAGKCYKARLRGTSFDGPTVTLHDPLGDSAVRVIRPKTLCNPASLDGSAILHPDEGRTCYRIKAAPNQPKFIARTLTLTNRYQGLDIEVLRPASLCVAAQHEVAGSPVGDAYTCYKARVPGPESARGIVVEDSFGSAPLVLGRVMSVCVPTGIDASSARRPDRYLVCHKISSGQPAFAPRDVPNTDAFVDHPLRLSNPDVVCISSRL